MNLEEKLREELGTETLLNELEKALSSDELQDNLEYIAKMYDVDYEEE